MPQKIILLVAFIFISANVFSQEKFDFNNGYNNKRNLFLTLINEGYTEINLGNYETFYELTSKFVSIKKLHTNLIKDGLTQFQIGTQEEFKLYFYDEEPLNFKSPNWVLSIVNCNKLLTKKSDYYLNKNIALSILHTSCQTLFKEFDLDEEEFTNKMKSDQYARNIHDLLYGQNNESISYADFKHKIDESGELNKKSRIKECIKAELDTYSSDPFEGQSDETVDAVQKPEIVPFQSYTQYVTANELNARSGPSKDYKVLFKLKQNDEVLVVDGSDGFNQIKINGRSAWVSSKYLSDEKVATWERTYLRTGQTPECSNINGTYSSEYDIKFIIKNDLKYDVAFKLVRKYNDECIRFVYIRSGDSYTMKEIPEGTYYYKYAQGQQYSQKTEGGICKSRFLKNARYVKGDDKVNFQVKRTSEGYSIPSFRLRLYSRMTDAKFANDAGTNINPDKFDE